MDVADTHGRHLHHADFRLRPPGLFNQPNIPNIPGREDFKGPQFHSARWDHSVDLTGKTVAVVGNGASGVQFIPKVAEKVKQLHLFMRTPQYVMPKAVFPGNTPWDMWLQKHKNLRWLARMKIYLTFERFIFRRAWFPLMRLQGEAAFRKDRRSEGEGPGTAPQADADLPARLQALAGLRTFGSIP